MSLEQGRDGWTRSFELLYRTTPHAVLRAIRGLGVGSSEELCVVGRRTGIERRLLVTAVEDGGAWYVGHANGSSANWVRNLESAGSATLRTRRAGALAMEAHRMAPGPERDRAVELTIKGTPFPVSIMFRLGRRHLRDAGAYFRLDPVTAE
jgi:F420H(2)-dependent quinone reductase